MADTLQQKTSPETLPQQRYDGGRAPEQMTEACYFYYCHWMDNSSSMRWITRVARDAAEVDRLERNKIGLPNYFSDAALAAEPYAPGSRAFHRAQLEMFYVREADSYLAYLNELLVLIFRTRPESLRSSHEKEPLEFILQYTVMDELIAAIVEKHVNALSYLGVQRLSDSLAEKHGLQLFSSDEQRTGVSRTIETRNVIVHNRGFVNKIFKSRVPNVVEPIGAPVHLSDDQFAVDSDLLARAVTELDERAVAKFGLAAAHSYGGDLEAYVRRRNHGLYDMTHPDGRRI